MLAGARVTWQVSGVVRPRDRIGQLVGQRYELVALLGQGGQGAVYKAFDRWAECLVAVKILGSKKAKEPQALERLMREQQAMSELKGTAAVQFMDLCRGNDGDLCLVMELLTGVDLDEHLYSLQLRKERMSPKRVAEIFDPVVSTLEVAHAAGILHRDLKPANIFLLENGGVRLLDFGMTRLKGGVPLTAAGTVMGSPSFMAPEAWKGLSDLLDARADVYSLGVMVFLALTGELPLSGSTVQEKFLSATQGKHKSLRELRPDLSRRADEWAARALAMDRDQRFGSVRALWDGFLTTFRVKPPGASLWARARGAIDKFAGSRAGSRRAEPTPVQAPVAAPWRRALSPREPREQLPNRAQPQPPANPPPRQPKAVEDTLDLATQDLLPLEAPEQHPSPPRPPDKTLSISAEGIVEPTADESAPEAPAKK
jgi:eukaryotic-like serine/threonine-protein kinase